MAVPPPPLLLTPDLVSFVLNRATAMLFCVQRRRHAPPLLLWPAPSHAPRRFQRRSPSRGPIRRFLVVKLLRSGFPAAVCGLDPAVVLVDWGEHGGLRDLEMKNPDLFLQRLKNTMMKMKTTVNLFNYSCVVPFLYDCHCGVLLLVRDLRRKRAFLWHGCLSCSARLLHVSMLLFTCPGF